MTAWLAAIVLLMLGCAVRTPPQALPAPPALAATHRSVWEGVYTEEQSRRGEAIYFASCVLCHKVEMTGSQVVPPLIGEVFLTRWNTRTAGDLFEWMRTSMPPVVTARLQPQEYADVLAYILSRNQFPPGQEELAAGFGSLKGIRMTPNE